MLICLQEEFEIEKRRMTRVENAVHTEESGCAKSKTITNPKIKTCKSTHNKQSKQIAVDQHKLL